MEITEKKDGGPAFPVTLNNINDSGPTGLTKREWFAGMALQGMLANLDYIRHMGKKYQDENITRIVASQSFEMADAMIEEASK